MESQADVPFPFTILLWFVDRGVWGFLLLLGLISGLAIFVLRQRRRRAYSYASPWATSHGYTLLNAELATVFDSVWDHVPGSRIMTILVTVQKGHAERRGALTFLYPGFPLFGRAEFVEVKWNE